MYFYKNKVEFYYGINLKMHIKGTLHEFFKKGAADIPAFGVELYDF